MRPLRPAARSSGDRAGFCHWRRRGRWCSNRRACSRTRRRGRALRACGLTPPTATARTSPTPTPRARCARCAPHCAMRASKPRRRPYQRARHGHFRRRCSRGRIYPRGVRQPHTGQRDQGHPRPRARRWWRDRAHCGAARTGARDAAAHANLQTPDAAFDLDFVQGEARELGIRYVLSNSFAFGDPTRSSWPAARPDAEDSLNPS